jgi:hypothetical protein
MSRHYKRYHPAAVILLGTVVLVGLDALAWLGWLLWHLLPLVLGLGCVWLAYRAGRRRPVAPPRPPKVIQGRAEDAEVIRLRAEVEALRAERDQARESARAAWQEASEPGGAIVTGLRTRLLRDPRSGARPFGGAQ